MPNFPNYLQIRNHRFYFRRRVPDALRASIGKLEITRAMGFVSRVEAVSKACVLYGIVERLFSAVENQPEQWTPELFAQTWQRHLKQEFAPEILKQVEVSKPVDSSPLLSTVIEEFVAEQKLSGVWQSKTEDEAESIFQLCLRIVGDIQISQMNYVTARDYKKTLCQLPANLNKVRRFRGKTIEAILKMKPKPASSRTINKNLGYLSNLCGWSVKHGYLGSNYFSGLQLKKSKSASDERATFTIDQLRMIFENKLYLDNKWRHPYQFWVPTIALFSGLRLEEIAQIHLSDIYKISGCLVFDVNSENDKKLKTLSSKRIVPAHQVLINAGIIEYTELLIKQNETRLFPELRKISGSYGKSVSKWFSRFRKKLGVEDVCFHSLRHNFATELKSHEVTYERRSSLLGHQVAGETSRYSKPSIKQMHDDIQKLSFDKIDWTKIRFDCKRLVN